jgi:iron(III) transport system permease protein
MVTIGAIIFLISPGTKVATVELFGAVRGGHVGLAAVIANIIMLVTLSVNAFFSWLMLRRNVREEGVLSAPATRAIDQVIQRTDGGR